MLRNYEQLKVKILELQRLGQLPTRPTDKQRADWAYGNAKMSNDLVTRAMAEKAVANKRGNS